jgi:hypothetical protein
LVVAEAAMTGDDRCSVGGETALLPISAICLAARVLNVDWGRFSLAEITGRVHGCDLFDATERRLNGGQ